MLALIDAIDEEADVSTVAEQLAGTDDPREVMALDVHLTRQLNERCGDIIGALLSAAPVEADVADAAVEGQRRNRDGCARATDKLQTLGAVRDDMTPGEAGTLIATVTWQPTYAQLTRDHGWTFDECDRWITTTLTSTLLP